MGDVEGLKLIGGLSFGGAPTELTDEQLGIAQEAAAQLAITITQARLYERVKRRAVVRTERRAVRLISTMQGRLGLALAREHRPDLMLADLHLPDLSGEDVLRELRADPRCTASRWSW